ncbi:MAG: hypothetical protein M1827_000518 [Pycnora praestabilis]|nr:MAG: hypothetical protein M1827_000518 [Pycnora praestabilis]
MFQWLTGPARPSNDVLGVEADWQEGPETPAPVFALRAFKTAIFGTPYESRDIQESQVMREPSTIDDKKGRRVSHAPKLLTVDAVPTKAEAGDQELNPLVSPTKPNGILMTPGTACNRRKTVSFGATVIDNEGRKSVHGGRSGLPNNYPGKFPSPWTPKVAPHESQKQTRLTRTLFEAREVSASANQNGQIDKLTSDDSNDRHMDVGNGSRTHRSSDKMQSEVDSDVTMDLNDPHSQSGRYWKSEYTQYQDKTSHEMKKLVKYKQLAKSYAKKKDSEALDLGEKLREERARVAGMEERISELAAQIAAVRMTGKDEGCAPAELMKELARQTATALEYKEQVDQFQAALELPAHSAKPNDGQDIPRYTSPCTEKTLIQTSQELKKAREQLQEMNDLRSELGELQAALEKAEMRAQGLESERSSFSGSVARLKEEMEKSEKRRVQRDERYKQRLEKLEAERDSYKEQCLQAKTDHQKAEGVLQKRLEDERLELAAQISVLKANQECSSGSSSDRIDGQKELEQKCVIYENELERYKREVADLRAASRSEDEGGDKSRTEWQQQQRKTLQELRQSREESSQLRLENERIRRELHEAEAEASRADRLTIPNLSDAPDEPLLDIWSALDGDYNTKRKQHPFEIFHGATGGTQPSRDTLCTATAALLNRSHFTKHNDANADVANGHTISPAKIDNCSHRHQRRPSLDSSFPALPSPEQIFSSTPRNFKDPKTMDDSTAQSQFSMALSPPKMDTLSLPLKTSIAPAQKPSVARNAHTGMHGTVSAVTASSRAGSLIDGRPRNPLPPDRAAAAKARLDQRNAEKQRTQKKGKENVKV